jgi:hypothetical protein
LTRGQNPGDGTANELWSRPRKGGGGKEGVSKKPEEFRRSVSS